jgi:hypothetical protein
MNAMADHSVLKELLEEDQAQRMDKEVSRSDSERRQIVIELLAQGLVRTANDKFAAAMIMQHTGLSYCEGQLKSLSPENYLMAHELFKQSLEMGNEEARHYVAASIDRYLTFTVGYQKYGTNILYNQESQKQEWAPIDRNTSDQERAIYGVPPLKELLKMHSEKKTP